MKMYTKPPMLIKFSPKQWKSNSSLCNQVQANLLAAEPRQLQCPRDAQGPYKGRPTQQSQQSGEATGVSCASTAQLTHGGCEAAHIRWANSSRNKDINSSHCWFCPLHTIGTEFLPSQIESKPYFTYRVKKICPAGFLRTLQFKMA